MNDLFLRACRREPVERTPIWLMRQAGRYLPEYRAVRAKADFVTLYKTPDLAVEVSLQPVDRLGVDAAILFSDILVPAEPMGFKVAFEPGPVLEPAVRSRADIERIRVPDPEETVPFVYETIRLLRRELASRVPLIGFGAAPFTLAAYLVEGGGSRSFERLRSLVYSDSAAAHRLLEKSAETLSRYLAAQARAGAQAIQLFDTWAGLLAPPEFREFAMRHARSVLEGLRGLGVPLIYFVVDGGHVLEEMRDCGADVIGLDWRTPLDDGARRLGPGLALQGNLDPCVLLAPPDEIVERARDVLARGSRAAGHVFNLGHGILPETPVEHARALVDAVKGALARERKE